MIRELASGDTEQVLALLRPRPLANVFLEHVVRAGALGRFPGFLGYESGGRIRGVLMIGPHGGTALEVADDAAFAPLAQAAREAPVAPRHIVGAEMVTEPFFAAYAPPSGALRWSRREPVYVVDRAGLAKPPQGAGSLERVGEAQAEELVANSARQHLEDLGDDRFGADPEGFRRRHLSDVREGRWWVAREGRRITFQVHVGPENEHAVQIGGVYVPPDLRGQGRAKRGVSAIAARLLERRPSVLLFCGEDNAPARRVYEHVGFGVRFHYRSYLLSDAASCPGGYA